MLGWVLGSVGLIVALAVGDVTDGADRLINQVSEMIQADEERVDAGTTGLLSDSAPAIASAAVLTAQADALLDVSLGLTFMAIAALVVSFVVGRFPRLLSATPQVDLSTAARGIDELERRRAHAENELRELDELNDIAKSERPWLSRNLRVGNLIGILGLVLSVVSILVTLVVAHFSTHS